MSYHENLDRLERDDPGWYGVETPSREATPDVHYHYGHNIPGYLPMSDDANYCATFDEARAALIDDMERAGDEEEDDYAPGWADSFRAALEEARTATGPFYVNICSDGPHDLGVAYWVMACVEDDCAEGGW